MFTYKKHQKFLPHTSDTCNEEHIVTSSNSQLETTAHKQNILMQQNRPQHIETMSIFDILSPSSSLKTYIEHHDDSPPPLLPHRTITRSQSEITKANSKYVLLTTVLLSKIPRNLKML